MSNFAKIYGKALAAVLFALVTAVQAAVSDGTITRVEWVQIAIAAATAVGVYLAPLHPDWPWAKTGIAVVLAVLNVLVTVIARGIAPADWAELVLAALTVVGVGVAPAVSTVAAKQS